MPLNRMRGQLALAAGIQPQARINPGAAGVPAGSGLDQAMQSVAGDIGRVGQRIGQLADRAAHREGEAEGRAAGLDPEFRTRADGTIFGEAFDRAGLQVAETRLKTELENGLEAAWDKHGQNAKKLGEAIDGVTAGIMKHTPAEIAADLQTTATRGRFSLMRRATREHVERVRAEQAAAMQEELQRGLRGLHQRAFALGLGPDADRMMAEEMAGLRKSLGRTGVDGRPLLAPGAARKLEADARREISEARIFGAFDRLPSSAEKARFISGLEQDFGQSQGLAAEFTLDQFRGLTRSLAADAARSEAQEERGNRLLAHEIRSVTEMAEKGYAPRPEDAAGIKARVIASGDERLIGALDAADATLRFQRAQRGQRPEINDALAAAERDRMTRDGATPAAIARIEVLERLADEARRELKADPLGWADRVGVIDVAPIDVQNLPASLARRVADAELVGEHYGQEPKYLRPDERSRIATAAAAGGAELLGVTSALAAASGTRAPRIMAELFEEAPVTAWLGSLTAKAGVTPVARDAADGVALMRTDGWKAKAETLPSAADARREAVAVHGGALAGMGRTEAAAIAATNAAYAVRAQKRGLTKFDGDLWRTTFREMLGEREIGGEVYGGLAYSQVGWSGRGSGIVVVPPDVKQDGFRELIEAIRMDDFGGDVPRYDDGRPASLADVRRATLVQAGDGRYALNVGSADEPRFLAGRDGENFVLRLDDMKPLLKRRRPDLYYGGR